MSKRSFLRKTAMSLTATLGLGGIASAADINLNGNTLTIGARTVLADNALRGAFYDTANNPPSNAFDSVAALRAYEALEIGNGAGFQEADLTINLDWDQDRTAGNPFADFGVDFGTNDSIFTVHSGEMVVSAAAAGTYTFRTASDDGSVVHIDGNYVLNNNFYQGRTSRQANYTLTEGVHPIVIGWYEGGGGANMTAYMSGGPTNAGEVILNPTTPLSGITFRKVSYTVDNSKDGMNVILSADSKIDIVQEVPVAFGSLSLGNNKLTTSGLAPISFTGTSVGATPTMDVLSNTVTMGPITGGPVTTFTKSGGGAVIADNLASTAFNGSSTLNLTGGSFTARSGKISETKLSSSIGSAAIKLAGGTFIGTGNSYEVSGPAGEIGVTFFSGGSTEAHANPIDSGVGLLARTDGKTIAYKGALAFDDDNPDFGHPNFDATSGGFVGVDNLQVMGYGRATFTTDTVGGNGDSYTFGGWSDDGITLWLDLDNDGKFEAGDNGAGQNELVLDDNSFHGPRVKVGDAVTIPAGTYRMASAFYEGGGNAVMDFRIARGTQSAADYDELKANFSQINPLDTSIISKISSILKLADADFTANPITVSANSGLGVTGAPLVKYGDVSFTANANVTTSGGNISINNVNMNGGNGGFSVSSGSLTVLNANLDPGESYTHGGGTATINNVNVSGAGTVGLNSNGGSLRVDAINSGANTITVTKSGAGDLVPNKIGGVGINAASTYDIAGGRLVVTNDGTGATTLNGNAVNLSGGTLQINTAAVNAGGFVAGLRGGRIAGAATATGFPTNISIDLGLARAQTTDNNFFGGDNGTWVYTGEIKIPDTDGDGVPGPVAFGEQFDDYVLLKLAGNTVINNNNWNNAESTGELEAPDTSGTPNDGWFEFEARFGQGGGGVGPNSGWSIGFGIDLNPADGFDPAGIPGATPEQYVAPVDNGTMNLFRTQAIVDNINFASNVSATQNSSINITGTSGAILGNVSVDAGKTLTASGNKLTVNDVTAGAGGVLQFNNRGEVKGNLGGAGGVSVGNNQTVDFTKAGGASTGTPTLDVKLGATANFTPGNGQTYGGATVSKITNEGTLLAANGTTDLSNAVVTTTNVIGFVPGLIETRMGGGFNTTQAPDAFGPRTFELRGANSRDNGAFGENTTWTYSGQIFIPDTDADGKAGPIAFGEHFDDGILVKVNGQEVLNNNNWDIQHDSGEIELTGPAGWYDFEARAGRGGGPNGQQLPWNDFGIGIDTTAPFNPQGNVNDTNPGGAAEANLAAYVKPVDPGNGSLFRSFNPATGNVTVNSGATLKVGALVGTNIATVNGNLTINSKAASKVGEMNLGAGTTTTLAVNGDANGLLVVNKLSMNATSVLDANDNDLVLAYTGSGSAAAADALAKVINGLAGSGAQIKSSHAAGLVGPGEFPVTLHVPVDPQTTFGAPITEWLGQTIPANSVIVKYTYFGDLNFDGQVDASDYLVVDNNFGAVTTLGPAAGDADLSGTVDAGDYVFIDNAFGFGSGSGPRPNPLAGSDVAAVPEPSSIVLAALGGLGGLFAWFRRRRKA